MPEAGTALVDALRLLVVPALNTSLALMLGLMLLLRRWQARWLTPVVAVLAVVAAVYVGNELRQREPLPYQFDSERPLTGRELALVLGWALESKPPRKEPDPEATEDAPPTEDPDEPDRPPQTRYWLLWLGGLAMLVELLTRLPHVSPIVGWVARTLVAVLAGRLLTLASLRVEMPWVSWCLAAAILLEWGLLTVLAKRWQDGSVVASLALCCAAASVLLLYGQYASLSEIALLIAAALFGPALVTCKWPGDTETVLAPVAVLLPGLMLICHREATTEVSWQSFLLMGLAPLALAPLVLPWLALQSGWKRWVLTLGLPLLPATVALMLAAQVETLPF